MACSDRSGSSSAETNDDRIRRARGAGSTDELRRIYRDWAESYDDDLFVRGGVIGSHRIAEMLAIHVARRSTPVLDLGCGTGAVGLRLAELGYRHITGLDLSPEMLEVAERTGAYERLVVADLNEPVLGLDRFDASVSAGAFTTGHVGPGSLASIVELLAPTAVVAWVVGLAVWVDFEPALGAVGLATVSLDTERIRRSGDDAAVMFVGRYEGTLGPDSATSPREP